MNLYLRESDFFVSVWKNLPIENIQQEQLQWSKKTVSYRISFIKKMIRFFYDHSLEIATDLALLYSIDKKQFFLRNIQPAIFSMDYLLEEGRRILRPHSVVHTSILTLNSIAQLQYVPHGLIIIEQNEDYNISLWFNIFSALLAGNAVLFYIANPQNRIAFWLMQMMAAVQLPSFLFQTQYGYFKKIKKKPIIQNKIYTLNLTNNAFREINQSFLFRNNAILILEDMNYSQKLIDKIHFTVAFSGQWNVYIPLNLIESFNQQDLTDRIHFTSYDNLEKILELINQQKNQSVFLWSKNWDFAKRLSKQLEVSYVGLNNSGCLFFPYKEVLLTMSRQQLLEYPRFSFMQNFFEKFSLLFFSERIIKNNSSIFVDLFFPLRLTVWVKALINLIKNMIKK